MQRLYYLSLTVLTAFLIWMSQGYLGTVNRTAQAITPTEIRGVWLTNVDSQVLFSSDAVAATLQQLADYHFNTVYPAVWSWGYTLFPSTVAKRVTGYQQGLYPDLEDEGRNEALENAQGDRDMLLEVIEQAHSTGLSVIPWFEFGFMTPANSPLAERHPEWLTQKQGSLPAARLYQQGRHTRQWLNPFHPEVQQFILDLIAELVSNYEVDGLQLDDHFGLPADFGYDPYTIGLYRREHNGQAPPSNPYNAEWTRWRANKITEFMRRIFWLVKDTRPDAILSVSPNPADTAYVNTLQDWHRWRVEGYIEELIIQAYRNNMTQFRAVLSRPELQEARLHIPTGVGILSGLKNQPVAVSLIQQQVQAARDMGFGGVSFFFYDTLWTVAPGENDSDRASTIQQLFTEPRVRTRL
ncbi:glycoside hydrolase family 10 protein [Oscillatoria sp. CS-180]|uniref:glycoside hydrolase family 10 protein n=1 Tax=Oscillatoria sp. CS-180 TaxID=3021720 RepID=UPI00232FD95B|nr:glycoside hydrolase family 10 protein [Oscillatoria sp. CS-180]MDB9528875.1 glycoside hydrolase family 10 protein [Oscillatoria sp. CS-180]